MMTAVFMMMAVLIVTLPLALVAGPRVFAWLTLALGILGLMHGSVIIVCDVSGAPLDYRFANSRLVFASLPVSVMLLATGIFTVIVNGYLAQRRATRGSQRTEPHRES